MLLIFCAGLGSAQPSAKKSASARHHASRKHRRSRKTSWKRKGQQHIRPDRALEIQEALVREKYLSGKPSGVWDARTEAAMVRYQADNGWQTKVAPDSRALIKLGLGPNYSAQQALNLQPNGEVVAGNPASARNGAAVAADEDKQ